MQKNIFENRLPEAKPADRLNPGLSQYMTPAWASSLIVNKFYPSLSENDFCVEPSCGQGSFLNAIPDNVPAIGIEVDPVLAQEARYLTGRVVHEADVLEFKFDRPVSHMIGNIPFHTKFLSDLLDKAKGEVVAGGTVGLILSCHMLQTSSNISLWSKDWSIDTHMMPRNIYPGLSKALCFSVFTKDKRQLFKGMALYLETEEINSLDREIKRIFVEQGKGSVWGRVIESALISLGGKGSLKQVYEFVEGRRPTKNPAWKQQIRKVIRSGLFVDLGGAVYAHPNFALG